MTPTEQAEDFDADTNHAESPEMAQLSAVEAFSREFFKEHEVSTTNAKRVVTIYRDIENRELVLNIESIGTQVTHEKTLKYIQLFSNKLKEDFDVTTSLDLSGNQSTEDDALTKNFKFIIGLKQKQSLAV